MKFFESLPAVDINTLKGGEKHEEEHDQKGPEEASDACNEHVLPST